jgi:hypothetical protein
MRHASLLVAAGLLAVCSAASPARADDPPASGAPPMAQMPGWLSRAVTATAEADGMRIVLDPGAIPGWSSDPRPALSELAKPLGDGRWSVGDVHLASPLQLVFTPPAGGTPRTTTLRVDSQDIHATIDPAFRSPSSVSGTVHGFDLVTERGGMRQQQQLDLATVNASAVPAADGRLDLTEDAAAENLALTRAGDGRAPLDLAAQRLHLTAHLDGVDPARLLPAVAVLTQRPAPPAPLPDGSMPDAGRERARQIYLAWRGVLAGGELDETVEGLRTTVLGHVLGIDRLSIGLGATTPDGQLSAHLAIGVDGLKSDELPPALAEYLPHHIVLQPSVSAVRLADLDPLIMAATAQPGQDAPIAPLVAALFAHGGITAGIDRLDFDLGPARFVATGKATALSPGAVTAQAQITATGFDTLISQVQAAPELGNALPVLVVMRQLAQPAGDALVWNISSTGGDLMVNGIDMSALMARARGDGK